MYMYCITYFDTCQQMSAIKSLLHEHLTDCNCSCMLRTHQAPEIMKHSTDHLYHFEDKQVQLSLDPYRLTVKGNDSDDSLIIRLSVLSNGIATVHNSIEDYLKNLNYDQHQLFIKDLHTELSNQIAAHEMTPPSECKLKAVD